MALGYGSQQQGITSAEDLLGKIVQSRHDDLITATYQDANPAQSTSDTANVDLEAPVVTLVSPTHESFTNIGSATMSAEVTDADAGVDEASIVLKVNALTSGLAVRSDPPKTPITDGYRITAVSQGAISEGEKKWFVGVVDKVGNIPTLDNTTTKQPNEGALGAASNTAGSADKPFVFTVGHPGAQSDRRKDGTIPEKPRRDQRRRQGD